MNVCGDIQAIAIPVGTIKSSCSLTLIPESYKSFTLIFLVFRHLVLKKINHASTELKIIETTVCKKNSEVPGIPALVRLRQKDLNEFQARQGYRVGMSLSYRVRDLAANK